MQYRYPFLTNRASLGVVKQLRSGAFWLTAFAAFAAIVTMLVGNALLSHPPANISLVIWALWDVPTHALLAMFVVLPLVALSATLRRRAELIFLAAVAATFIDLDHFAAARSLSLAAALHLPMRPVTHSLLFALAAAVGLWFFRRNLAASYTIFAALASHVFRDSVSGVTPIFWPLPIFQLPATVAFAAIVLLCGLSLIAAARLTGRTVSAVQQHAKMRPHSASALSAHTGQSSRSWQSTPQTAEVVLSIDEAASTTANPLRDAMPR